MKVRINYQQTFNLSDEIELTEEERDYIEHHMFDELNEDGQDEIASSIYNKLASEFNHLTIVNPIGGIEINEVHS